MSGSSRGVTVVNQQSVMANKVRPDLQPRTESHVMSEKNATGNDVQPMLECLANRSVPVDEPVTNLLLSYI